jgi:hypothetical protein
MWELWGREARPALLQDDLGTRYSFRERLEDGHTCWRLKRLGQGDELRPIFLRVVTKCLAASESAGPPF